jgi:hypothetical protein
MLQHVCITCFFLQIFSFGNNVANVAEDGRKIEPYWKTIIEYRNQVVKKMDSETLPNKIYLNQNKNHYGVSNLLLKKNLKEAFTNHKRMDVGQRDEGNLRLTVFRNKMRNSLDMSILIKVLSKPEEEKKVNTLDESQMNNMRKESLHINSMRKKTMNDKSQLIWMRVN